MPGGGLRNTLRLSCGGGGGGGGVNRGVTVIWVCTADSRRICAFICSSSLNPTQGGTAVSVGDRTHHNSPWHGRGMGDYQTLGGGGGGDSIKHHNTPWHGREGGGGGGTLSNITIHPGIDGRGGDSIKHHNTPWHRREGDSIKHHNTPWGDCCI